MITPQIDNIIGVDNRFIDVLERVSSLAKINKPILLLGERGTGKELFAHRLHYLSPRWQGAFVSLNCAALSDSLLDSELFGHEAGAFTGAQKRHQGRFERADGGTLFLDELATAPMQVQEKLLRVIEYGQLERVGGNQPLHVDVRLVCATNEDLPELASKGKFRADLLDRLTFDVIRIPPLRERRADIMVLAEHFAISMSREMKMPFFAGFSTIAKNQLMSYSWPGNIRELKNVVERSLYRQGDTTIQLKEAIINPFIDNSSSTWSENEQSDSQDNLPVLPVHLRDWQLKNEYLLVQKALQQSQYNQRNAAKLLGITYHQLRGLIKKHQLNTDI